MTSANNSNSSSFFPPRAQRSYANVAAGTAQTSPFNTLAAAGGNAGGANTFVNTATGTAANTSGHTELPTQRELYDRYTAEQEAAQHTASHIPSQLSEQAARQRSKSEAQSMEIDGRDNAAWKRPVSSWSADFGRLDGRMGCLVHDEHPAFFTPSYLRSSRHVQRLQLAWDEHMSELREEAQRNPPPPPKQPSLSTSSSNVNLNKMHAQHIHRPPVQDVIERLPPLSEEDKTHPLPSRWSEGDHMNGLEVLADGSEVRFTGVTKSQDEAASVRADHHMPKEVGLYYFEVTVLSRGKDGLIGIGFSGRKVNLNRLPGWEADSWAYHGDDGFSFACTASGKAYGPRYSSQDVIGCGVNFRTGNAFFTKNGVYLGELRSVRNSAGRRTNGCCRRGVLEYQGGQDLSVGGHQETWRASACQLWPVPVCVRH